VITYELQWGASNRATISTAQEFDDIARGVETQRGHGDAPFQIVIVPTDRNTNQARRGFLAIGVGNPDRAFAFWAGEGGGWGRESAVAPLTEELAFDYCGEWTQFYPDQTCVMPETAKAAAREYITTGRRPTGLTWWDPDNEPAEGAQ
jgi:hypothetical protein